MGGRMKRKIKKFIALEENKGNKAKENDRKYVGVKREKAGMKKKCNSTFDN